MNLKSEISDLGSGTPLCPGCGYDLRGLPSDRCPECGLPVDASADLSVTLPWAHRRTIGRARAYCRTVGLTLFRTKRLAANIARPVDWADAVRFRRVTAALAAGPVAAVATVIAFLPSSDLLTPALSHPLRWWAELLAVPVAWAGLWLAVLTAAGVASYWFHPRSIPVVQQNRAVALSYYACGPLALVPVIAVLVLLLVLVDPTVGNGVGLMFLQVVGCAAFGLAVFVALAWYWTTVGLVRLTTHCGLARQLCLAVWLPVAWAVLAAVFAVGLPVAYLWLALVVKNL